MSLIIHKFQVGDVVEYIDKYTNLTNIAIVKEVSASVIYDDADVVSVVDSNGNIRESYDNELKTYIYR